MKCNTCSSVLVNNKSVYTISWSWSYTGLYLEKGAVHSQKTYLIKKTFIWRTNLMVLTTPAVLVTGIGLPWHFKHAPLFQKKASWHRVLTCQTASSLSGTGSERFSPRRPNSSKSKDNGNVLCLLEIEEVVLVASCRAELLNCICDTKIFHFACIIWDENLEAQG